MVATPNINKPPAMATKLLPISSHWIAPKDFIAEDITCKAADIAVNPTPMAIISNPPPANLENTAISVNIAAIPTSPLINSSVGTAPNPFTA